VALVTLSLACIGLVAQVAASGLCFFGMPFPSPCRPTHTSNYYLPASYPSPPPSAPAATIYLQTPPSGCVTVITRCGSWQQQQHPHTTQQQQQQQQLGRSPLAAGCKRCLASVLDFGVWLLLELSHSFASLFLTLCCLESSSSGRLIKESV